MGFTGNQCFEVWELSTAAKLHFGCDGLHHQLDMCVVLDRGEVEGKRSRADQAAEVVGGRGEEETLLVTGQNVRSHDEEHDGQAEQEAVEPDLAEAAQRAPAPRRLPLHLQDCEQVHGRVVHLQEQRPLAVLVHCGAQQAVFVVHLRHGVDSLRGPRYHGSGTGGRSGAGSSGTGGFGTAGRLTVDVHDGLWRTAHLIHGRLPMERGKRQSAYIDSLFHNWADAAASKNLF